TNERKRVLRIDFDEGEVLLGIASNVMRVVSLVVVCNHLNLKVGGALHYVLVSHDISGRIDDEPGAQALQSLAYLPWPPLVVAKELRVKFIERVTNRAPNNPLGIDVNDGRQDFGDRQHRRFGR